MDRKISKNEHQEQKEILTSEIGSDFDEQMLSEDKNPIFLKPKILIPIISIIIITLGIILYIILNNSSPPTPPKKEDDAWDIAYKKAEKYLENFNLTEKISLLYGTENMLGKCCGSIDKIPSKNFTGICLQDGPAGVRFSKKTTSWQSSINTASTFDKNLIYKVGEFQGREFYEKGINIMLGPCLNIMRMPIAGRVWESYGEDPFLNGEAGALIIKGIQSQGVIATAKHFVGNDQETNRKNSSSNIPEQALWEIYIEPFYKAVVKGDVGAIMESYNAINGTFVTENKRIIQDILKNKIGFRGFVMTDWWAIIRKNESSINCGVDMNMPGGRKEGTEYKGKNESYWSDMENWVKDKVVSEERINDAAKRIIATMYKLNQTPNDINAYPSVNIDKNTQNDTTIELNRKVARDSIILLQNEENILPINKNIKSIAIIGNDAIDAGCLPVADCSCINSTNKIFQGHMALGYGSGTTSFNYISDPLTAITKKANELNITITSSTKLINGIEDIETAKKISNESDISIIFINSDSGEDYITLEDSLGDRYHLNAWHNGNELVENITEITNNIIVVINAPSVINLPWKDKVKGIIFAGFPGAESGNALVDILFGDFSPSGHLTYVWGKREDYPTDIDFNNSYNKVNNDVFERQYYYNESIFIGQRWFDLKNIKPIFPFGFGLSYSKFNFSNLNLYMNKNGLNVTFDVENVGNYNASVVGMVFLGFPDEVKNYPVRVFKGFDKKFLTINEKCNMQIIIEEHDLSYYNLEKNDFLRPRNGIFKVYVGENARDFVLNGKVEANY